jgi:hypothetical protein
VEGGHVSDAIPALLDAHEVARRCAIKLTHAYALMRRLGAVKIGACVRLHPAKLDAYLANLGDTCPSSTSEPTARTTGAPDTTQQASGGTRARSRRHSDQRKKLRELSSASESQTSSPRSRRSA